MLYIAIATAIVVIGFCIYKRKSNKVTFPLDCFLNEQSAVIDYEVRSPDFLGVVCLFFKDNLILYSLVTD